MRLLPIGQCKHQTLFKNPKCHTYFVSCVQGLLFQHKSFWVVSKNFNLFALESVKFGILKRNLTGSSAKNSFFYIATSKDSVSKRQAFESAFGICLAIEPILFLLGLNWLKSSKGIAQCCCFSWKKCNF